MDQEKTKFNFKEVASPRNRWIDRYSPISVEDLILAVAPSQEVVSHFLNHHKCIPCRHVSNNNGGNFKSCECDESCYDFGLQDEFSAVIAKFWYVDDDLAVPRNYLLKLLQVFVRWIQEHGQQEIESDRLMQILKDGLVRNPCAKSPYVDPDEVCHVQIKRLDRQITPPLRFTIYPYHNDVSLRLWEAGAVLAEFLVDYLNTSDMLDVRVLELGGGVGATALVIAGSCHNVSHVLCTDFTSKCLENLDANFALNVEWLAKMRQVSLAKASSLLSHSYLEWKDFADGKEAGCMEIVQRANLMIAADVCYDTSIIESLVLSFARFFAQSLHNRIIYAMTIRNQDTFKKLQTCMLIHGISSSVLATGEDCQALPIIFPTSFTQPRSDVCIYELFSIYNKGHIDKV